MYGFDPSYKTWIHHGELNLPPPPLVTDNIKQPQMNDMASLLNDLSYIPLNNKQNEPTQGDIGETSNDPNQAKRNEFEELYASTDKELYPGCDYVTRLDFMAKFTYFKVKGKLTDSIFDEMLEFFQNVFSTAIGYKLPPSYFAIKKTFKIIRLGYKSIPACVNDCFLFQGDANKYVHLCPVCNTSRWKDSNTPRNKVPKKVLRYFLIIPRLQRLYKSSHTAKEMTWHATGKFTEPDKMQHPVDDRAWKDFDTKYPDFAAEPRNVRLGLAVDRFNPFGNQSSFMLTLLIPGFKSTGKDVDVYLRPLIDVLKDLWAKPDVMHIEKNVLESILNTLLKNEKSKDTIKARQDLERLGIQSGLWLSKNKNGKCSKPQAAYSFTPKDRKKFVSSSKELNYQMGSDPTSSTKLQQYLHLDIAKPLIELCLFFKKICSQTLMVDDMLKAQRKVIRIDHQELKKVIWYVLHNSPEIDTYRAKFKRIPRLVWKADNDLGVSESSELFALACGPSQTPISVNSCVVNGVRNNITQIKANGKAFKNDQYILITQVKQCFYLEDMARRPLGWKVVEHVSHKKFLNGGVIIVEDDPDVIHVDNSSDLKLFTSLNDFEIAALHIDGQSIDVDAPPDIIDVVDEDNDIIDEKDPVPHDLADSDDEDLVCKTHMKNTINLKFLQV
nr:hypothetical protein [Tanacetum cinerariifolium]